MDLICFVFLCAAPFVDTQPSPWVQGSYNGGIKGEGL